MAHDEAARSYDLALALAARAELATPAVQTELLVELAEARWRAGHTAAARDAGRRALAIAKPTNEPGAIAAAALAFAGGYRASVRSRATRRSSPSSSRRSASWRRRRRRFAPW
jgi:hypothetical protein